MPTEPSAGLSTEFGGTPSDDLPGVLATGRGDATTIFTSLSARHPDGGDADYLRWHALDHRPEQHRLTGLRGSLRLVSTSHCRAARAAADPAYAPVDHVMAYLFTDPADLGPFAALGGALRKGGRMWSLPSVELEAWTVAGRAAASRTGVGADVIWWRPALGVYLLLEAGPAPAGDGLTDIDGVAGAWWATLEAGERLISWAPPAAESDQARQVTFCFLDEDPPTVAARLRPALEARWSDGSVTPRLAAPFLTVDPHAPDRHLP